MTFEKLVQEYPYFHGESLEKAIDQASNERLPLIHSLIAENSLNLWYAKDGAGKSLLAVQTCIESSAGLEVFGSFMPVRPLKIIYFITERHPNEVFERIKRMKSKITINSSNIIFDASLQGLDIQSNVHRKIAVERALFLADKLGTVDLCCFDPMYAMTSGKMTGDEGASNITEFSRRIQNLLGSSNLFLHHPNRGVKIQETGQREGEDIYGNRFLMAHFTSIYHIKRRNKGTYWTSEKDTYHFQQPSITTTYDPETDTSYIQEGKPRQLESKVLDYFKAKSVENKPFTFRDFIQATGVSVSWGREIVKGHLDKNILEVLKNNGKESLYFARYL